jgi:hypothetical protein
MKGDIVNQRLLILLAAGIAIGLAPHQSTAQAQAGAGKKREGPDPGEVCEVSAAARAASLRIMTRNKDFDCPHDKNCQVPIEMGSDPRDPSKCVGTMDFDRIVVDRKGQGKTKRIVWELKVKAGETRPVTDFEFDETDGIRILKDSKKDFDDRKRESPQRFSYRNKHSPDATACFIPKITRKEADGKKTECSVGDPLIWNQ